MTEEATGPKKRLGDGFRLAAESICSFTKTLVAMSSPEEKQNFSLGMPDRSLVVVAIRQALFEAVRKEWEGTIADAPPKLADAVVIAKRLMNETHGTYDLVCGLPGHKAMIVKVDGVDVVSYEDSMSTLVTLSAIYANKVREVLDIVEAVEAEKKPPELSPSPVT